MKTPGTSPPAASPAIAWMVMLRSDLEEILERLFMVLFAIHAVDETVSDRHGADQSMALQDAPVLRVHVLDRLQADGGGVLGEAFQLYGLEAPGHHRLLDVAFGHRPLARCLHLAFLGPQGSDAPRRCGSNRCGACSKPFATLETIGPAVHQNGLLVAAKVRSTRVPRPRARGKAVANVTINIPCLPVNFVGQRSPCDCLTAAGPEDVLRGADGWRASGDDGAPCYFAFFNRQ